MYKSSFPVTSLFVGGVRLYMCACTRNVRSQSRSKKNNIHYLQSSSPVTSYVIVCVCTRNVRSQSPHCCQSVKSRSLSSIAISESSSYSRVLIFFAAVVFFFAAILLLFAVAAVRFHADEAAHQLECAGADAKLVDAAVSQALDSVNPVAFYNLVDHGIQRQIQQRCLPNVV